MLKKIDLDITQNQQKHYVSILLFISAVVWIQNMFTSDLSAYNSAVSDVLFARESIPTIIFNLPWWNQSPLYYLFLHVWKIFGESPGAVRSLNYMIMLGTFLMTFLTAKKLSHDPKVPLMALAFMMVSPVSLWVVRDGRMYGLMGLLTLSAFYMLLHYLESQKKRDLVIFVILLSLNIYNHFIGFWISAIFGLWILSVFLMGKLMKDENPVIDPKRLNTTIIAGYGLVVLAIPQIVRLLTLISNPRDPISGISLPKPPADAFREVTWFLFLNTQHDRGFENILIGALAIIVVLLMGIAFFKVTYDKKILIVVILMSVCVLVFQTSHMDLRARYFTYIMPFVYIFMALGVFEKTKETTAQKNIVYRFGLIGVLAAFLFIFCSGVSLAKKIPEAPPPWTALLKKLELKHTPGTSYFVGKGPNFMKYTVDIHGLNEGLKRVHVPRLGERNRFVGNVFSGYDFVFIKWALYDNASLRWMKKFLKDMGYKHESINPGLRADIYRSKEKKQIPFAERIPRTADLTNETDLVRWIRDELDTSQKTSVYFDQVLRDAVVARVYPEQIQKSSTYIDYGPGEGGLWKISADLWDSVEHRWMRSDGEDRRVLWAHPRNNSILMIAFPNVRISETLNIFHGFSDSGINTGFNDPVQISVYLGNEKLKTIKSERTKGWKTEVVTVNQESKRADLIFLIKSNNDRKQHFALGYQFDYDTPRTSPIDLKSMRLSSMIDMLNVYRRTSDQKTIHPISYDSTKLSAETVHEKHGKKTDTGWVKNRWILSYREWDMVGFTRQKSKRNPRSGIWAHPKNRTTLVMEAKDALLGKRLKGYGGFTDHSLKQSEKYKAMEPVELMISLNGRRVFFQEFEKERGWQDFEVPINEDKGELVITVNAKKDKWSHFVFDLWSES